MHYCCNKEECLEGKCVLWDDGCLLRSVFLLQKRLFEEQIRENEGRRTYWENAKETSKNYQMATVQAVQTALSAFDTMPKEIAREFVVDFLKNITPLSSTEEEVKKFLEEE